MVELEKDIKMGGIEGKFKGFNNKSLELKASEGRYRKIWGRDIMKLIYKVILLT